MSLNRHATARSLSEFRGPLAALAAILLTCATGSTVHAQALPHNIPDFTADASRTTVRSIQTGTWSSASTWAGGVVPTANHVVHVDPGHVVTIGDTTAVGYTVAVHGTLRFNPSVNTRLKVTNLMIMGDHGMPTMSTVGYMEVGTAAAPIASNVTAEIIIANSPIGGGVADPEQFGTGILNFGKMTMHGSVMTPTFVRLAVEPRAGHTTLTLSQPVSGWRAGDRLVIPDTRHIKYNETTTGEWINAQNQWEELTVQSISADNRTVTLTGALQFDHLGARDLNNVLDCLPHVGNLTRNVIVRSESATGTRGHTIAVHIADTDLRYVRFKDLGRTMYTPLNTTTNAIGRYPIHMHHNRGPLPTPANGYQFTLMGNAVDGGSAQTKFKWGITVHNSHYGLIQDNVVYNYNGSAIATEDGSESFNVFDHNFVMRGIGEPNNSVSEARTAMGTEGVGFWFRGPNNYVRNNVAANYQNETTEAAYGFVFQFRMLGNVAIPNFKGADPSVAGQFTTKNGNNMPIPQFENNEAYGAMQGGLTYWWLNSVDGSPFATSQESVFKNFKTWHVYNKAVYVYPSAKVTIDGLIIRGAHAADSHCCGGAVHFNDYSSIATVIRNSDIQGMGTGIDAPASGYGPEPNLLVENSILRNWTNISVPTPSSTNGCWMQNMLTVVANTQLLAPPGRSLKAIEMDRAVGGAIECLSKRDEVRVYAYNGNVTDNFQIYHTSSAVLPRPPTSCTPTTRTGIDGLTCPIAALGAPAVTLTALPQTITSGQLSTLSWTSSNATTVSINQGIGTVVASGTLSVSPTATTTYTITATNGAGTVTATATVTVRHPLSVSVVGSGTVVSAPAGINCTTGTCSANFNSGSNVQLTATPAAGWTFTAWSGACSGTGACTVTMTAAQAVTATFTPTYVLSVTTSGTGSGTVTSSPAGIDCGATCSASYLSGTPVSLTPTAATGSIFGGWSGACSGTGSCIVAMTAAHAVTATFTLRQRAQLTSPAPGSTLTASAVTFQWTGGAGVAQYWLSIGTAQGASDLHNQDRGTQLSAAVSALPTNGITMHVRLWSRFDSTWEYNDYTVTAATTAGQRAELTSPAPGSTLTASAVTFQWTGGTGVAQYWLSVGTALGGIDLYNQDRGTQLTAAVSGLPTNGSTLYIRVWSRFGSQWVANDYTLTATTTTPEPAQLTSPAPGSTLTSSAVTFQWTGGTGVSQYWLSVGSAQGGNEIYYQNRGTQLSADVSGLPTNGSTLHVRLWSRIGSTWQYRDYTLTAMTNTAHRAQLVSPAPGATLTSSTVTFQWTGGTGVSQYWLAVGSTQGGIDLYNQDRGTQLSATVPGLPSNGSTLHVRVWSRVSGIWEYLDYVLTSVTGTAQAAQLTSPAPGSTLTSSTVMFQWTGGIGVAKYWLSVGTTQGGADIANQDSGTQLSASVAGLPTNGSTLHVRLWSLINAVWQYNDYVLTATSAASQQQAELTSPAGGSTLTASVVTFHWTGGIGASQYWLQVGATEGGSEIYNQNLGSELSATVPGLPSDGSAVHVRLWSLIGASWEHTDYALTAPAALQ